MSEDRKLEISTKTIFYLRADDSVDLDMFPVDLLMHLNRWEFIERTQDGPFGPINRVYARYIGPVEETPDEIEYVWHYAERYWGVSEMDPARFGITDAGGWYRL